MQQGFQSLGEDPKVNDASWYCLSSASHDSCHCVLKKCQMCHLAAIAISGNGVCRLDFLQHLVVGGVVPGMAVCCCSAVPHTFLTKNVTKLHATSVHVYIQSCACHGALLNPETSIALQRCHSYTRNINSETSADSTIAILHCDDVLGVLVVDGVKGTKPWLPKAVRCSLCALQLQLQHGLHANRCLQQPHQI